MPKYLLLKHYTGGPTEIECPPMDQWTPEEITTHMEFQREVARILADKGELVDAQALSPTGSWVRYGGPDTAPDVLDGPFAETKELIAGWFMIDVESEARAHEVAALVSRAPGKDGEPVREWLEVRPVMEDLPAAQ
jgi:hypothetical protein